MARYKPYNLQQDKLIPLSYADQVLPGSFEYALNEIVEEHPDLRVFERPRCTDTPLRACGSTPSPSSIRRARSSASPSDRTAIGRRAFVRRGTSSTAVVSTW
jgi:hypothetical protein